MISPIINSKILSPIKIYIYNFQQKRIHFIDTQDCFEKGIEFINDVVIRKRISPFKITEVQARIYKQKNIEDNTEKYILSIDGIKKLGEIDIKEEMNSIFISNLESYGRRKYKGIGSKLLQIAVEKSLLASPHKTVNLNAQKLHTFQKSPRRFYSKMGFKEIFNINPSDLSIYGNEMCLYHPLNRKWQEKINFHPIFKKD